MGHLHNLKLGIYEKAIPWHLSWREKMMIAKDAGYDFIEMSIDGLQPRIDRLEWGEEEINDIRRASEETGIPILTMALTANRYYPLGDERPEIRNRGIEIVLKGIDLAVKIGIRVVQIAAYDVVGTEGTPTTDRLFRDALKVCSDYAARNGVMLSIEVMDVPYSNTVEKVKGFIDEVNSPFLQIYTDTGNIASSGINPASEIANGKKHIVAMHIKDAVPGCSRKIPFGEGIVDFEACFKTLQDINYNGFLVAEMWSDEDMDFLPYLKTACDFIREKMQKVQLGDKEYV